MFNQPSFEERLSGGDPDDQSKVQEVVDIVLEDKYRLEDLFQCFFSNDALVRTRTGKAMCEIALKRPRLLRPYINRIVQEVSNISQSTVQSALAQIFLEIDNDLNNEQRARAISIFKSDLKKSKDPDLLRYSAITLGEWAKEDEDLKKWLIPRLEKLSEKKDRLLSEAAQSKLSELSE